jgi:hypothetical protein
LKLTKASYLGSLCCYGIVQAGIESDVIPASYISDINIITVGIYLNLRPLRSLFMNGPGERTEINGIGARKMGHKIWETNGDVYQTK